MRLHAIRRRQCSVRLVVPPTVIAVVLLLLLLWMQDGLGQSQETSTGHRRSDAWSCSLSGNASRQLAVLQFSNQLISCGGFQLSCGTVVEASLKKLNVMPMVVPKPEVLMTRSPAVSLVLLLLALVFGQATLSCGRKLSRHWMTTLCSLSQQGANRS